MDNMDLGIFQDEALIGAVASVFDWEAVLAMEPIPEEAGVDLLGASANPSPNEESLACQKEPEFLDVAWGSVFGTYQTDGTSFVDGTSAQESETVNKQERAGKLKDCEVGSLDVGHDFELSSDTMNGIDGTMEESVAVAGRPNRRKALISTRNVEEDGAPDGAYRFHNMELVDFQQTLDLPTEERPKRHKTITGPPKMHEMDPRVYPKAKGAVYSRMNREKKKSEFQLSQLALAKALKEVQFLKGRIAFRDGILKTQLGDQVLASIQFGDNQNQ